MCNQEKLSPLPQPTSPHTQMFQIAATAIAKAPVRVYLSIWFCQDAKGWGPIVRRGQCNSFYEKKPKQIEFNICFLCSRALMLADHWNSLQTSGQELRWWSFTNWITKQDWLGQKVLLTVYDENTWNWLSSIKNRYPLIKHFTVNMGLSKSVQLPTFSTQLSEV